MRTVCWNILALSLFIVTSAQVPKDCTTPEEYPHTRLSSKFKAGLRFSHKQKVYYSCAKGFVGTRGSRSVECIDGKWSKLTLKCDKQSCGNAGDLPNGHLVYEGNTYTGAKATAVCNDGYTLKGPKYLICKETGWTGGFPSCVEGETTCSKPTVANSAPRGGGASVYRVGDSMTFTCNQGFQLDGAQQITCGPTGQWQPEAPRCLPSSERSCDNPGDLPNGRFVYEGNTYTGAKATAVCNDGYTLKGPKYLICKETGWTGGFPLCVEGEITCSTPTVANSVPRGGSVPVYRVGDGVTFTCSQGFQLDGAKQITCGPTGQWQPEPPQCLPSSGDCGVPPTSMDLNANLADRFITRTSFSSGEKVYYMCNVGYTAVGGSRVRQCQNGNWTPVSLKCKRRSCGSVGEIVHGEFVYSGIEFGDTATAVCNEGYILVGHAIRRCSSRGWDGRTPVCEVVACEDPPTSNAEIRGRMEAPYQYRSVVSYRCRVGALIGEKDVWCTKNGTWSAPAPTCKEITCPSPKVPNAFWSNGYKQVHQYMETIYISCHRGYSIRGPDTAYCQLDGSWYPGLPKCQRMYGFPRRY
ncbi:complement receptor type 1-like [Pholidichthys leucotaenia]